MNLQVLCVKTAVTGEDQPRFALQFRGIGLEQIGESILLEVFLRGEDVGIAVLAETLHHQRCVPGGGATEGEDLFITDGDGLDPARRLGAGTDRLSSFPRRGCCDREQRRAHVPRNVAAMRRRR